MEFKPFPKIPRLSREIVVTEKIDGTNASIFIQRAHELNNMSAVAMVPVDGLYYAISAASRNRWIVPADDNYGFAAWVRENCEELIKLGEGHHFGEWWGRGIQRGYNLDHRRFSLFNVSKWHNNPNRPQCCHVVPVLFRGAFRTADIEMAIQKMEEFGSLAAPGFMQPEGVIIYHTAGNLLFKKTIKNDEKGKG